MLKRIPHDTSLPFIRYLAANISHRGIFALHVHHPLHYDVFGTILLFYDVAQGTSDSFEQKEEWRTIEKKPRWNFLSGIQNDLEYRSFSIFEEDSEMLQWLSNPGTINLKNCMSMESNLWNNSFETMSEMALFAMYKNNTSPENNSHLIHELFSTCYLRNLSEICLK
ncbi:hypothetical protein CEXT_638901 [Caerostris extrusa]|uniref:Uncharacterized protein n=1 Tax=Caerostris extrusa TaxID=172846 RepID=A0AAV4X9Q0_CAEEX|nr:hypothetical protein CEXT_638901 [Caerostris extrusa]